MSKALDTQSFPLKKFWVAAALDITRTNPTIYSAKAELSNFRKIFLAGTNQRSAIKNWLSGSGVIKANGKNVALSHMGETIRKFDENARDALTWWLIHLHLSANDNFPYSAFFKTFDVDGGWLAVDDIVDTLCGEAKHQGIELADETIKTYFAGVDSSLRPGQMLYLLGLVERRKIKQDGAGKLLLRRTSIQPNLELIVYAALLLHRKYFRGEETVETKQLIKRGFSKILGMRDSSLRDQLAKICNSQTCATFVEYTRKQDIDSIYFKKQGNGAMEILRDHCYSTGVIKWK